MYDFLATSNLVSQQICRLIIDIVLPIQRGGKGVTAIGLTIRSAARTMGNATWISHGHLLS